MVEQERSAETDRHKSQHLVKQQAQAELAVLADVGQLEGTAAAASTVRTSQRTCRVLRPLCS